jgi:uncharacterized RDD family membrane protein YckC
MTTDRGSIQATSRFTQGDPEMQEQELEYVGFWARTGAAVIDSILVMVVTVPLLIAIYGWSYFDMDQTGFIAGTSDFLISWILPAVAVILFWLAKQATPGKIAISARIVDAALGNPMSTGQSIGRYLGYFVALLPLGVGIFWVAFDKRKQGWHDKLAGTVVVREIRRAPESVKFGES